MALERYSNSVYSVAFPNKYAQIRRKYMCFQLCFTFTIFGMLFRHKYTQIAITNPNLIVNEYGNEHYFDFHELQNSYCVHTMYELCSNQSIRSMKSRYRMSMRLM